MSKRNVLETGFTAEDFDAFEATAHMRRVMCDRANALLAEAKRDAQTMRGFVSSGRFFESQDPSGDTHTGLLIDVRPIGEET